jgi:hypothetical protein
MYDLALWSSGFQLQKVNGRASSPFQSALIKRMLRRLDVGDIFMDQVWKWGKHDVH